VCVCVCEGERERERISFSLVVCQGKTCCLINYTMFSLLCCLDGKQYKLLLLFQYMLSIKYVLWI